ncbi:MAG TPA: hypothetical protein VFF06_15820 [Polyangia bacterium]|nr:hypothetical protein [Polyangia bacterium]
MNLRKARVVLRLRSLTDILDLALRVAVENGRTYRKLGFALLVPAFAACLALRYLADWTWWAIWPTAIALATLAQGAFTVATGQLLFDDAAPARTLLARFAKNLPRYFFALLLTRCVPLALLFTTSLTHVNPVAALFLLLSGLLLVRWAFVHEAVLLEGAGAGEAARRSSRILKRHGGAVMGLLFWSLGAQLAFVLGAELIGQGVVEYVFQLGQPFGALFSDGGSLFALGGLFLSVPYLATARFLQYIDLRTRKEGWDIQLKFTAIQAEAQSRRMAA